MLLQVIITAMLYAGIKHYQYCSRTRNQNPTPESLQIPIAPSARPHVDTALHRLRTLYSQRREAIADLADELEGLACVENINIELTEDLQAAYDSVEDLDRAIALLARVDREGSRTEGDLQGLLEQVHFAEEAQGLWMRAVMNVRARWRGV